MRTGGNAGRRSDDPEDPDEEDGPPGDRHGRLVQSEPIEGEQDQGRQDQAENEDDVERHLRIFSAHRPRRPSGEGAAPRLRARPATLRFPRQVSGDMQTDSLSPGNCSPGRRQYRSNGKGGRIQGPYVLYTCT